MKCISNHPEQRIEASTAVIWGFLPSQGKGTANEGTRASAAQPIVSVNKGKTQLLADTYL